jgi:hypothetical protein
MFMLVALIFITPFVVIALEPLFIDDQGADLPAVSE